MSFSKNKSLAIYTIIEMQNQSPRLQLQGRWISICGRQAGLGFDCCIDFYPGYIYMEGRYMGAKLWSGRTGGQLQTNWLSLKNNRWKFTTAGNLPTILEEFIEYTPILKGKPEDVNMSLVGLANTRISTGYAHKSPRSLGMGGKWRFRALNLY